MNIGAAVQHLQGLCQQLPIENHQLIDGRWVDILRLDSIDPVIQGNKAAKLLGHLQAINNRISAGAGSDYDPQDVEWGQRYDDVGEQPTKILSFGGRHSNHLHALAKLGALFDIPMIGFVHGYPQQSPSPTLRDCHKWRMQIVLKNKKDYAQRNDEIYRRQLGRQYNAWVIAEGGGVNSRFADAGLTYWLPVIRQYQRVWLASGSGTTMLGLMRLLSQKNIETQLLAVNCVADRGHLTRKVSLFNQENKTTHRVIDTGHGGGFGRFLEGYSQRQHYYSQRGLAIEPVYMDKLLTTVINEDIDKRSGPELLIHGGGLQGARQC